MLLSLFIWTELPNLKENKIFLFLGLILKSGFSFDGGMKSESLWDNPNHGIFYKENTFNNLEIKILLWIVNLPSCGE